MTCCSRQGFPYLSSDSDGSSTCFKPFLDGSVFAPLAKGFGVSMWGWENSKNDKPLHLYSHWYWNEALKFHFM